MELNKIHLDADFNNTVVPVGQRFLFLGYLDGDQSTNEIVIRYKDSDGNFGNLSSDSEDTTIEIEREITEDNIQDGNIVLSNSAIPVSIKTSNNNIYPIEKDTLKEENGKFIIELEPYLAYENTEDFVSPWTVYYGGGAKGEKGDKGDKGDSAISVADPIVETLAPEEEATARAEIDEDGVVTFTFGIPQGDTGRLNVVVSETEPSNPVEGMIWIPSLY